MRAYVQACTRKRARTCMLRTQLPVLTALTASRAPLLLTFTKVSSGMAIGPLPRRSWVRRTRTVALHGSAALSLPWALRALAMRTSMGQRVQVPSLRGSRTSHSASADTAVNMVIHM